VKKFIILLFTGLIVNSLQAKPFEAKQVSAGAKWVIHLDFDGLKDTEVGKYLMKELMTDTANQQFAAIQDFFHFDPRSDLNSATLYGSSSREEDVVVLVGGKFDAAHIITLLESNLTYKKHDYESHVISEWVDENKKKKKKKEPGPTYGCFHPKGTLVVGNKLKTIKGALDILDGRKPGLAKSSPFSIQIKKHSSAFLVAAANLVDLVDVDPNAAVFKKVKSGLLVIGEDGGDIGGKLLLDTDTTETAEQVRDVVVGIRSAFFLNDEKQPKLARLARAIKVSHTGKTVQIGIHFSAAEIIKLIQEKKD